MNQEHIISGTDRFVVGMNQEHIISGTDRFVVGMNQEICRTSTKPERECVLGFIAGSGDVCVFGIVYLCGDFFDVRRTMLVPKIVEKKKSPVCPSKVTFFWAKI